MTHHTVWGLPEAVMRRLVLILFWDTHRLAVAITMLGVYAAVAIALGTYALRRARSAPRPFTATLAELRKDRAALTRGDS